MMRYSTRALLACAASAALVTASGTAMAVPYAAQTGVSGTTVNWVLNETADTVTISREGQADLVLNAEAPGAKSFSLLNLGDDWSIKIDHSAPVGWANDTDPTLNRITNPSNIFTTFDRPYGVAVNKNPGSPDFGSTYVGQARDFTNGSSRILSTGVYKLNADFTDAFGGAANDPAKSGGLDWSGSPFVSPWYMNVGQDDTLYVSDWSDGTGGIKYLEPDLGTGGLLLADAGDALANTTGNHGSIGSAPVVTGTRGSDLKVWAIDEDRILEASPGNGGNNVLMWDVGTATSDATVTPTMVVDSNLSPTDSEGGPTFLSIAGVRVDMDRDPSNGNIVIAQWRSDGNESGLMFFDDQGNLLWSSRQFTIDNELDGFEDDFDVPASLGYNDIFRNTQNVKISPDGKTLAVGRRSSQASNLALGTTTPYTSGVLLIDLDPVTGLPDITVSGGVITDGITSVTIADGTNDHTSTAVEWDLAGNLYTGNNVSELVEAFGPGGVSSAITSSDGTFTINGVTYGGGGPIEGDLNGDGFVGIADLNIVLGDWNNGTGGSGPIVDPRSDPSGDGFVGIDDLNTVLGNWNAGTPPASVIPEPATLALLGLGGLAMLRRR